MKFLERYVDFRTRTVDRFWTGHDLEPGVSSRDVARVELCAHCQPSVAEGVPEIDVET